VIPRFLVITLLLFVAIVSNSTATAQESIPDFVARMGEWKNLVGVRKDLEGRSSSIVRNRLSMKGCQLTFVFGDDDDPPPLHKNVRLIGRIEKVGARLEFKIEKYIEFKSDLDTIDEKVRLGDTTKSAIYYETANWALKRGEFYSDDTLKKKSVVLNESGLRLDYLAATGKSAETFLALAGKATQMQASDPFRQQCLHSATQAELIAQKSQKNPAWSALLDHITERFPDSAKPLAEIPQDLWTKYRGNPNPIYNETEPELRSTLHRLLYLDVVQRKLSADFDAMGKDGFAAATWLEEVAPDLQGRAATLREKELDYITSQVPRMRRKELLEFSARLKSLEELDRESKVREQWMKQRQTLYESGRIDRIDYSDDLSSVMLDNRAAADLLAEELRHTPDSTIARNRLDLMGYLFLKGKAILKENAPVAMPDPFLEAIELGRVIPGMTGSQVRAAMGGGPERTARIVTRKGITELWNYADRGLTISLARGESELTVLKTTEIETKRSTSLPVLPLPSNGNDNSP